MLQLLKYFLFGTPFEPVMVRDASVNSCSWYCNYCYHLNDNRAVRTCSDCGTSKWSWA